MPIDWKNEELRTMLKSGIQAGKSFSEVAEEFSIKLREEVTRSQIAGAHSRLFSKELKSNPDYQKYKEAHTWTAPRIELLRRLHAEGYNDGKIAEKINEATGSEFMARGIENCRRKLGLRMAQKRVLMPRRATVLPFRRKKVDPVPSAFPEKPKSTVHEYAVCKWINGDPKGIYSVCAQPAAVDAKGNPRSWCPHHCSIVYIKPGERRPDPTRFA